MFVSVIVPLYNDSKRVIKLLTSLEKQTYPRESFEIIVVDNGSDQDTGHLASRFNIRLACETGVRSSYAARNKGIQMTRGDILCFTDSDCVAGENWITEGVKALQEKEADLVGGNVVFTLSSKKRASEFYDAITNMQIETIVRERGVAITANLFIRKHVIDTIGSFPHHLKSGGDIYLTAKAVQNGFRLVYSAEAYVFHPARPFLRLLQKSVRVGNGKSSIYKLSDGGDNEIGLARNVLRSKNPLDHLNPLTIKKRLKKTGYRVGFFKFLSILLVSYCYLFAMFLSQLVRSIMDKRMGGLPGTLMAKTVQSLKRAKKWMSMLLALLLVVYIVYYIFHNQEDFSILKSIRLPDIGLLFVVVFFSTLVSAVRLLMVMRKFGLTGMDFLDWFRIFVLARFFNRVVPQGGNLYRALKLKRENRFSLKKYTLSFFSYTWIELMVTFILISGVIVLFQPCLKIGAFPALPLSILLAVVLIVVPWIYYRVVKGVRSEGFFSTSLKDIGAMVKKTLEIRLLLKNVFLCVLTFVLALLLFYLAFRSIGAVVGIGALSVFTVIMRMGLIVSLTPGNIGVLEIAYGTLASSFGFDFSVGLMVAAVTRTVSFIAALLFGTLFGGIPLVKSIKEEKKREQDECMH